MRFITAIFLLAQFGFSGISNACGTFDSRVEKCLLIENEELLITELGYLNCDPVSEDFKMTEDGELMKQLLVKISEMMRENLVSDRQMSSRLARELVFLIARYRLDMSYFEMNKIQNLPLAAERLLKFKEGVIECIMTVEKYGDMWRPQFHPDSWEESKEKAYKKFTSDYDGCD